MCFLQLYPDKKTTTFFLAALSCLASRSKSCYPMCFKISSLFTRRVVKLHLLALLVWFPACHVLPLPCSYSKILSSFFLQLHLTHVVGTVCVCCCWTAALQWDCPRGQLLGELPGACSTCLSGTSAVSLVAAGDVWPSRVISGLKYCCILQNYLFCVLRLAWAAV